LEKFLPEYFQLLIFDYIWWWSEEKLFRVSRTPVMRDHPGQLGLRLVPWEHAPEQSHQLWDSLGSFTNRKLQRRVFSWQPRPHPAFPDSEIPLLPVNTESLLSPPRRTLAAPAQPLLSPEPILSHPPV